MSQGAFSLSAFANTKFNDAMGVAMSFDGERSTRDESMRYLNNLIDLVFQSGSLAELCTRLVHSRELGQAGVGAHIYGINGDADLVRSSGYGFKSEVIADVISGADNSVPALAVRLMRPVFRHVHDPVLAIPCAHDRIPNACLVTFLSDASLGKNINEELLEVFSKAVGFFVSINPVPGLVGVNRRIGSQNKGLTPRQQVIISLMADSLTNATIARELLVSESTVRQEAVKIFRELGVSGRTAAVSRARELNLINR
jgi:DNA-binding CsgD family transcriptional regulator